MLSHATSKLLKFNCHSIPICVEFELVILGFIHLNLNVVHLHTSLTFVV